MKILDLGLTRRGLLKRIGVAAAVLPVARLGKALAEVERRKRKKRAPQTFDDIWIGHF